MMQGIRSMTHVFWINACLLTMVFAGTAFAADHVPAQAGEANALIVQGDQQWIEGNLNLAQKAFEQAVIAEPRSVRAHMRLAGLHLYRQEFKACIETYQQTIGLDAKNARAWLGLGFAYLHTGKNELSLAAFNEAIRVDPGNKEKLAPVLAKLDAP